ncbi:hypothetical protein CKM354_000082600 [Cercospora kikuchii]|uniref:Trimethyllysine dioxygenase n=1 Tax=Cercospora kikuchii TaxID=84275 RepID=A0A9P3CES6_9PEZI|nr:uncharacterized protein CKM354_000082600 [Cercospora kikuchii]GIZ37378.1 hypothetical protein CKM354_000082600 [Cercospora kikuchii]
MPVANSMFRSPLWNHLGGTAAGKLQRLPSNAQPIFAARKRFIPCNKRFNATVASSQPQRVDQDAPFDRRGGSLRAWQSTAMPDHFLSSDALRHPLPKFEDLPSSSSRSLRYEGGELKIHDEIENRSIRIPGQWLRDNCACSQCRNTDTAQRQINVLKGDINTTISNVHLQDSQNGQVTVTFSDGHQSAYSAQALLNRRSKDVTRGRTGVVPIKLWTAEIASARPAVQYTDVKDSTGMSELLQNIRTFGFCVVENMPATPEATESLLNSIGPIRNTHYGGFYDFTSDLTMKDTAYTSEFLEPHTDNTYFTEPAGIQALHMLSHTQGSGGESSLTDGFNAATQLFVEDREAYLTLSEVGVYAHASGNEGILIQPSQAFPVLNHDSEEGFLNQIRWNNADRAGIAADFDVVEKWYAAAEKFDRLLSDKSNQYWFQLKPGQTLLFDNWRVLHGRNEFTGKRRMCGGYISRDDFISKYRVTNMSKEELEVSTVSG